ncbi:MAG: PhoH family protein [Alphaproteobacteria bacterium]|nr:PhoH family protein [Alphaproteobacteria bacterium]MCD8570549.1 PhoH family protein [Alphaproteobacteria bacterium]
MQRQIEFSGNTLLPLLFGPHGSHLLHLEKKLGIQIADRGNTLTLSGDQFKIDQAARILDTLWDRLEKKQDVGVAEIDAELRFMASEKTTDKKEKTTDEQSGSTVRTRKKHITPRSPNQAAYLEAMKKNDMVFGFGPAGTGKTYLAVAMAVSMFIEGSVERLIFTRPAVEAGENLGFLPGDMKEKVDPYLRPIYDALHDMLHWDVMMKKMESGDIEIAPLAFMRGRTLSNAFVILDEAQNTTCSQMKMFLTRMGEGSRMVVTGDLTQTDLPRGVMSGLREAYDTLEGVEGISFCHFNRGDVVRHPLVGRIVEAYEKRDEQTRD